MKTISLAALLISSGMLSGLAVAQEGTQDFQTPSLSSRTRAEVIAELEQARSSGRFAPAGEGYGSVDSAKLVSTRTRAEVLAELADARSAGALDTSGYSATYGSFRPEEIASTRPRSAVLAELAQAQKVHGGLSRGQRSGS